jgi:hypothetical protein
VFENIYITLYRHPTFSADWQKTAFPLSALGSRAQGVSESGAFVMRHTRDGQLLAIAANQLGSYDNRLVYVSVLPAVATITDLRGMGTRFPLTQNPRYSSN